MKRSVGLGIAFAIIIAAPTLAGETSGVGKIHHRHAYRHMHWVAQVPHLAPRAFLLPAAPLYPNGQGDEDGLSRHIGDCNKGCIGGNPG